MAALEHLSNTETLQRFLFSSHPQVAESDKVLLIELDTSKPTNERLVARRLRELPDLEQWVESTRFGSPFMVYRKFLLGL